MKHYTIALILISSIFFIGCEKDDLLPTSMGCVGNRSISIQCSGVAASTGVRCLNKTYNCSGYCFQHESQQNAGGGNSGGNSGGGNTNPPPPVPPVLYAPILSLPINGSIDQPLSIELKWNPASGATRYNLQVSKSSSFTPLLLSETGITSTSKTLSALSYNTRYYWRVSSTNASNSTSPWSTVWSFVTLQPPPPPPAPPVLPSGLLIWKYLFNGNIENSISNQFGGLTQSGLGTTVGGVPVKPSFTPDRFNNSSSAFYSSPTSLKVFGSGNIGRFQKESFTVAIWFKTSQSTFGNIIQKEGESGLGGGWSIKIYQSGVPGNSSGIHAVAGNSEISAGSNLNDNNWHHIAMVRDVSTSKLFLYIDGILRGSKSLSDQNIQGYNLDSRNTLFIGSKSHQSHSDNFTGSIDDIFMYTKALTSAEILNLKNLKN